MRSALHLQLPTKLPIRVGSTTTAANNRAVLNRISCQIYSWRSKRLLRKLASQLSLSEKDFCRRGPAVLNWSAHPIASTIDCSAPTTVSAVVDAACTSLPALSLFCPQTFQSSCTESKISWWVINSEGHHTSGKGGKQVGWKSSTRPYSLCSASAVRHNRKCRMRRRNNTSPNIPTQASFHSPPASCASSSPISNSAASTFLCRRQTLFDTRVLSPSCFGVQHR